MVIEHTPRQSALGRSFLGEAANWDVAEYLAAAILDGINSGNWQRGGGKGSRPKKVERPGTKQEGQRVGAEPIPIKDFDSWWDDQE